MFASPSFDAALPPRHMPGLDVLRGTAIIAVFLYHCMVAGSDDLAATPIWAQAPLALFWKGYLGVHLFFVLSGFLITGILLDADKDNGFYRAFYARRIVRIVPAYCLTIFVLWIFGVVSAGYIIVCLLYLCNMPGFFGLPSQYGPFWSLSVEEQFYIVWPMIVAKLPRDVLFRVCWIVVLATPLFRLCLLLYAPSRVSDIHYKTWDLGDFFAAGAILALYARCGPSKTAVLRWSIGLMLTGAALTVLGWNMDKSQNPFALAFALEPTLMLCAGLLALAYRFPGSARTLPGRILTFLGAISYGFYLVHQFIIDFVIKHVPVVLSDPAVNHAFRMMLAGGATILIAFISRYTFEAYFLRFRWRGRETKAQISATPEKAAAKG